ncbi:MAG TPA: hypothetical protein VIL86_07995, partial [Tepidisphaeraceae bacterium]
FRMTSARIEGRVIVHGDIVAWATSPCARSAALFSRSMGFQPMPSAVAQASEGDFSNDVACENIHRSARVQENPCYAGSLRFERMGW